MGKNAETGGDLYRHYVLLRKLPVSKGDHVEIEGISYVIKNITKNQTYKMKPFSEIIGKIIEAGGLFKYKPD